MTTMTPTAVDIANEVVSIFWVCNHIGMGVPDHAVLSGRSVKVHCPFGDFSHSDGGTAAAFRIYPATNSAWCFACSELYPPVKLYAAYAGLDWPSAAAKLLELIGHRPATVDARWEAAVAGPTQVLSLDSLADALKTFCARIDPAWSARQFEQPYSDWLDKCLALLSGVNSEPDAVAWLSTTKLVMERELKAGS